MRSIVEQDCDYYYIAILASARVVGTLGTVLLALAALNDVSCCGFRVAARGAHVWDWNRGGLLVLTANGAVVLGEIVAARHG